ncbi:hypothetical protein ELE36_16135 [Pseudolysobacter antarcticus]|uniref:Uncharacterized protein n=1 Tax=Pseudolysobacter antarcticus TaxID=2511995 RepID=A0A411HMR4_9GAMM|nr:hypothetical protein [Pseudolysobacter antarcticus]QBB71760.1 hypothetical protein ELE36_16135 [Pseudolysobacter antarcticus]
MLKQMEVFYSPAPALRKTERDNQGSIRYIKKLSPDVEAMLGRAGSLFSPIYNRRAAAVRLGQLSDERRR